MSEDQYTNISSQNDSVAWTVAEKAAIFKRIAALEEAIKSLTELIGVNNDG